jgi:hypothetical protein
VIDEKQKTKIETKTLNEKNELLPQMPSLCSQKRFSASPSEDRRRRRRRARSRLQLLTLVLVLLVCLFSSF